MDVRFIKFVYPADRLTSRSVGLLGYSRSCSRGNGFITPFPILHLLPTFGVTCQLSFKARCIPLGLGVPVSKFQFEHTHLYQSIRDA